MGVMRKQYFFLFLIALFCACGQKVKPKRYASVTGLKKEKMAYYRSLHAHAWPGVLAKIRECHISNYSIYVKEIDSNYYLFSYFEYTGQDYTADMKKMAADSLTRKWWEQTDPCQLPLPDAEAKAEVWSAAEVLFYLD